MTMSNFVYDHFDKGSSVSPVDEEYKHNKYFDLNDKNQFVPYGIIIVFMEDVYFDRIFNNHNQTYPIIPCGSKEINYLLPYLKISPTCGTLWLFPR